MRIVVLLFVALLFSPAVARGQAALHSKVTLEQQTADASRIIVGVVTRLNVIALTTTTGDEGIFTEVTLNVLRTIKGTATPTITLTIPGGTLDGITMKAPNDRIPAVGERLRVFVTPFNTTRFRPLNGHLGLIRSLD